MIKKLCVMLLAVVLLGGCTAMRLGYRHADTLLAWRADEYFDMDAMQKSDLNVRLDRLLEWHRREQLPDYAAFFSSAAGKARGGLKHDDVLWFIDGFKSRYQSLVNHSVDDAAELLATLRPEQLVTLQKQWVKDNRKFAREHGIGESVEHMKKVRLEHTIDQIDDWTGSLSDEQTQKISVLLEQVPLTEQLRSQDRMRRQKEFLELLNLRSNRKEFKPKLQAWLVNWDQGRSAEYKQVSDQAIEKRIEFYIAVEKILTPAQRDAVLRRMQNYVEDFKTLSSERQHQAAIELFDLAA